MSGSLPPDDEDFLDSESVERLIADIGATNVRISSPQDTDNGADNNSSASRTTVPEEQSSLPIDTIYKNELTKWRERNRQVIEQRNKLPAYAKKDEILSVIAGNKVILIAGETGCGKTTQVPQYILDEFIERGKGSACRIMCTQPRRISAIAVAERVAKERGETCGKHQSVGYRVRLHSNLPRKYGSIVFCTTGVALQWKKSDIDLISFSHIIVDEVHERNVETDFLVTLLRDLLERRGDVRVILMSATMWVESFSEYFDRCPVITISGRTYPVERYTLEDVSRITKCRPPVPEKSISFKMIKCLVKHICETEDEGAILIFLPGWMEINQLCDYLLEDSMFQGRHYLIIMLHSMIPVADQKEVFERSPPGVRKIVLSTNIAETSITIDDVVYVIDSGLMRLPDFNRQLNIKMLYLDFVAKSNARQREGRAGRVKPGKCYSLLRSGRESRLPDFHTPEIVRTRLENLCLKIKSMDLGDIRMLLSETMDRPPAKTVTLSIELLKSLGALDDLENLTPLGMTLSKLPLDPHLGKMLLYGAIFSCLNPIVTIVATLEYKEPFRIPMKKVVQGTEVKLRFAGGSESDHIMFFRAFDQWEKVPHKNQFCKENFLSPSTLEMIDKLKRDLVSELYNMELILKNDPKHPAGNVNSGNEELLKGCICAGLYPNIASGKKSFNKSYTEEHGELSIHRKSIVTDLRICEGALLVYYEKMKTDMLYLFDVTVISQVTLDFFGGQSNRNLTPEKQHSKKAFMDVIDDVFANNLCLEWEEDDPNVKALKRIVELNNSGN